MNDYVIAIPSYKRQDTLKNKTMKLLERYKVPKKRVYIFVADNSQKNIYQDTLDKNCYNKIIVGKPGIKHIRNFMANYFPEGKRIVYLDDDINKLWRCVSKNDPKNKKDNKLIELESLHKFICDAFKLSKKTGYRNWGPYPIENPFFMKPTMRDNSHVSTDLKFVMGGFNGVTNDRKAELRTISDKEDYERTIKYYLADGGVLRFNNISCSTRCYKGMGGIQATRKAEDSRINAMKLIKNYPNLVRINNNRKSGFVEIRLRDSNKTKLNINNINKSKTKKNVTSKRKTKVKRR